MQNFYIELTSAKGFCHMKKTVLFTFIVLSLTSCKQELKNIGDTSVQILENTPLYFDIELNKDTSQVNDSILRLDAGRVLLKKLSLPSYEIQPKLNLELTLRSSGCVSYTSPSPRDRTRSRMPSSA